MNSIFEPIDFLPEDPILSIPVMFAKDPHPKKVNLGIGVYHNEKGSPFVLEAVKKAERIVGDQYLNKNYLPIDGDVNFLKGVYRLVFGENPAVSFDDVCASQSIGGTGALSIGGIFLSQRENNTIALSDPSWPNHLLIFKKSGLKLSSYPYFKADRQRLEFSEMCQCLSSLPSGTTVLLHASCHNPTGVDPSFEQWKEISKIIKEKKLIPFFDLAYQGMGVDLEQDTKALRYFAQEGHEMIVTVSFSKNMGLYGERVGALFIFPSGSEMKKKISTHIKQIVRSIYSNPPIHGVRLVATIFNDQKLLTEWKEELSIMCQRIIDMRLLLQNRLMQAQNEIDFSFLSQQKGFFSLINLKVDQVKRLKNEFGIYLLENGRINIAGINEQNVDYIVDSFIKVMKS